MASEERKRRREVEDGGGIDDDGNPNPIPDPILFPARPTALPPGPNKVATLALRYHLRAELWHADDCSTCAMPDYVGLFKALGETMYDEILAERGIRWAANGISEVPGPKPGDPPKYRAQIWDPGLGPKGDHIELGYADTPGEAKAKIVDYYRRYVGVDTRVEPPEWLKVCLRDAIMLQAEYSDSQGGVRWDLEAGHTAAS